MGYIKAICISEKKGTPKTPVSEAVLVENHGIRTDAHAGNWHRQVSILSCEAVEDFAQAMNAADTAGEAIEDCVYNDLEGSAAIKDMYDDLFPGRITQTFFADLPFNRDSWHGRMLACRGTMASMDEQTLKEWEKDHTSFLNGCPDTFTVRHLIMITYFTI